LKTKHFIGIEFREFQKPLKHLRLKIQL
jgi:hypothetical protein